MAMGQPVGVVAALAGNGDMLRCLLTDVKINYPVAVQLFLEGSQCFEQYEGPRADGQSLKFYA